MTRHFSPNVQDIADSVYSGLAHRLATHQGEVFPLHVGDTWMEPPAGCRMEDLHVAEFPGMHRYASPQGMPALLDAIVERVRARTGVATERDDVLVATGATG
ncbi:MAG TPA: pyridoxal phosphate-dependent aminotransferase, partial [Thermoanaerobaculia bacterium]